MTKINVLVFGSSHVARMRHHVESGAIKANPDFKNATLNFRGFGGLTAEKILLNVKHVQNEILKCKADIVVLLLGCNDLDCHTKPNLETVAERILHTVQWLRLNFACKVTILNMLAY